MRMFGIGPFFQLQNHQKAEKEKRYHLAPQGPSLTIPTVSVDVKQHWTWAQELCEGRGGRPVPNSQYGLNGCKVTLNLNSVSNYRAQELCESRGGRPELPVPNNPYSLCRRNLELQVPETYWQLNYYRTILLNVVPYAWRTSLCLDSKYELGRVVDCGNPLQRPRQTVRQRKNEPCI